MNAQEQAEKALARGDYEAAISAYHLAIETSDKNDPFRNRVTLTRRLTAALVASGQIELARTEWTQLVYLGADTGQPHLTGAAYEELAEIERRLGNRKREIEYRESALVEFDKTAPSSWPVTARVRYADAIEKQDPKRASRLLEEALELTAEAAVAKRSRAVIQVRLSGLKLRQREIGEARRLLDAAQRETAEDDIELQSDILMRSASLAIVEGRKDEADQLLLSSILKINRWAIAPVNKSELLREKAEKLWAGGYFQAARSVANRAAEILAVGLASRPRNDQSKIEFSLPTVVAKTFIFAGDLDAKLEDFDSARAAYRNAVDALPADGKFEPLFMDFEDSHPDIVRTLALLKLAEAEIGLQAFDAAIDHSEQALSLAQASNNRILADAAEFALAEARGDVRAFSAIVDQRMKDQRVKGKRFGTAEMIRISRFYKRSPDMVDLLKAMSAANGAIIAARSPFERYLATKSLTELVESIASNPPGNFVDAMANNLPRFRAEAGKAKEIVMQNADRIVPIDWPPLAEVQSARN